MTKIRTIIGSTRAGWNGCAAARGVHGIAVQRTDTEFEIVWREVS
ncbi:hypothetical protein GA0070624_5356 [Micromonospora rhizosphaerae]|uniref:Uncharacterized protein n=1 Tax=Micromonospora rhizosphaerae TaxID=568872 RepID=A0A1C6T327_9ACTN|nr:hypothetical protein GA0070624_5356 [Micromonospora rhizosphaerae]